MDQWYKDAIIYQTHIKAFRDSNGDGYGDIQGLITKLDYIESLGVNALWLLPFYPSPLRDDGYDIAEYEAINPQYGSVADFKQFLDEAHRRGIRVITELVINHTSDQHPWFKRARSAPKNSPERNFYVWSDDPNKYSGARIIFTDTENSNWAWDPVAQQFYWHRFFNHQPDLNFDNPAVLDAVINAMQFWLRMGVDGLRLDAIPYLVEREGTNCENIPETHVVLKKLRAALDQEFPGRIFLAEANQWPTDVIPYFGDNNECHMAFHFPLMPRMYMALRREDRSPIVEILAQTPPIPSECQWAIFLRNHDELTLEMVTDEDRDYMYNEYARDARMRINVGIRRRLAPLLDNGRRQIELMNALLLSMPGTPIIYYGDEIGMGDNVFLGDRNGVRTPMQWSGSWNAGFSDADSAALYFPLIVDAPYGYQGVNVHAQERTQTSLLRWMRRLIKVRKGYKAFGRGSFEMLLPDNRKVLVYLRELENETILCVSNLSRFVQPVEIGLERFAGWVPVELFGKIEFPRIGDKPYFVTLSPHAFFLARAQAPWLKEERRTTLPGAPTIEVRGGLQAALTAESLAAIPIRHLENWLGARRWFGAKGRKIASALFRFVAPFPLSVGAGAMSVLEVSFEGSCELAWYQLPLIVLPTRIGDSSVSPLVLAHVVSSGECGIVMDATEDARFRGGVGELLGNGSVLDATDGSWVFEPVGSSARVVPATSRLGQTEQSNTSIVYGESEILKLFRKLEVGEHPDVEIARFLTTRTTFRNTPELLGSIRLESAVGASVSGMLARYATRATDAWAHALFRAREYLTAEDDSPANPFAGEARELGRVTRQLHEALSSAADDPAFAPVRVGDAHIAAWADAARGATEQGFDLLARRVDTLDAPMRAPAQALLRRRGAASAHVDALARDLVAHDAGLSIRHHGDFHLGQVLRAADGEWIIIDFEGEPTRPLAARRALHSPLRDVAGMQRSFAYAASSGATEVGGLGADARVESRAARWERDARAAFLEGYFGSSPVPHVQGLLPDSRESATALLTLFEVEKVFYELDYELNNRPSWAWIPLRGIAKLF